MPSRPGPQHFRTRRKRAAGTGLASQPHPSRPTRCPRGDAEGIRSVGRGLWLDQSSRRDCSRHGGEGDHHASVACVPTGTAPTGAASTGTAPTSAAPTGAAPTRAAPTSEASLSRRRCPMASEAAGPHGPSIAPPRAAHPAAQPRVNQHSTHAVLPAAKHPRACCGAGSRVGASPMVLPAGGACQGLAPEGWCSVRGQLLPFRTWLQPWCRCSSAPIETPLVPP